MKNHYSSHNRIILFAFLSSLFFIPLTGKSQNQDIKPTINPAIFSANTEITVTYDMTGNTLANLANAWIWVWIPGKNTNAKYNVNPASGNAALTDNAKFTKTVADGKTIFSITFTPANFFDGDISQETQLGMLLKGNDWANGQTTDFIATLSQEDQFSALLVQPEFDPLFVNTGEKFVINAISSEIANYSLSINGILTDAKNDIEAYNYEHTVTETGGIVGCALTVTGIESQEDTTITFNYIIRTATIEQARPSGIISGINYHDGDDTKVTLCLLAPMKNSVFVLGEFNDFTLSPDFQMYKDNEYFWLEIDGLTPGLEYAFQYLVDESVYVADPYADKILDPDDKWIPASIYPNLKSYPQEALRNKWYFNRLAVFKTAQTPFSWKNDNYSRPEKDNLIIYELLIRDFFDENNRSYDRLIDTLSYFKSLGINAIELMPVQEFNGNESWGYNPTFMFAPDKAYGTKDKLKALVDAAHEQGIAVILDVVFNHQDIPNPYAAMYFDFTDGVFKPTPDNPWFNVQATHPFSVFFDMNHESAYTKYFMDTTLHYWINEYKIDGFRFDLSKGFTQTVSGSNVSQWGQKDQSRIDILTRMADKVWSYAPDTWLMLEHFANNEEETILADYGMMLWGNMHGAYKETILGFHDNNKSNLEWGYAPQRGWQDLNLITYMESHDEERQMYDASLYGNTSGSYSIKQTATALDRVKAASAFLYLVPGPKMFWQFGELGYDISINQNGRTGEKPVLWNYYNNTDRKKLHDLKAELIKFRLQNPIFSQGQFLWQPQAEVKRIVMGDDNMKMVVIGNFGVNSRMIAGNFPEPGTWYDFFTGNSFQVSNTGMEMLFEPGEFHIYTTKKIEGVKPNLVSWGSNFIITALDAELNRGLKVYPNPVRTTLQIHGVPEGIYRLRVTDMSGRNMIDQSINYNHTYETNVAGLPGGIYQLSLTGGDQVFSFKIIKN
jgi:1,4-alpha-glucan branching enzyme